MRIDLHTHFIPRDCFDMRDDDGRPFGPTVGRDARGDEVVIADGVSLGPVLAQLTDPDVRLKDMDRIGLDVQCLSINPSSLFHYMPVERVVPLYRRYNDALAEVVTAYPDRFVGLAALPVQSVPDAVAELERAFGLGLRAVALGSNVDGRNLDDPVLWPLYRRLEELDIPVFVHPYYVAAAERMSRYWLVNTVGNPIDTAIAIGSLVFGGVLRDFPRLRFAFAHGGGAMPYIAGRWDHAWRVMAEAHSVPEPPIAYVRRLYFDTLVHSDLARAYLVDLVGAERVVLGSDYPFAMGDDDPVRTLLESAGIAPAAKETILGASAARLLNINR